MRSAARSILVTSAALYAICAGLIGGLHALARQQPTPTRVAALLPDDTCAAPCWQGLRPGYVSDEALRAWLADPPGEWIARDASAELGSVPNVIHNWRIWWHMPNADQHAHSIILTTVRVHSPYLDELQLAQAQLTLGELIAALGTPPYVGFHLEYQRPNIEQIVFRLYYPAPRLIVEGALPGADPVLTPDLPITRLRYKSELWGRPALALDWQGLGTFRKYYPAWERLP